MARFDLNLLASLDALLRKKSVSAAAEEIGVSQPAMSGMLKRLREHLQDPILVRAGTQYELSVRAQELCEPLRQALLTIEELTRPSSALVLHEAKRHIRIMASEFSQMLILPELFRRAIFEAPKLSFEVLPIFDPISRVYLGEVDLCLTAAPLSEIDNPVASLIRAQKILEEECVALVDKNHPLQDPATIDDLQSYPHVATQFPGLTTSVEEEVASGYQDLRAPTIKVPSFLSVPPMIVGTLRIWVAPKTLAGFVGAPWNLRSVSLPPMYRSVSLRTLWHVRYDMDPLHRWLRSTVQEAATKLQYSGGRLPADEEPPVSSQADL
ncbi:MAG: LysR family transcriptional regulator [Verrucomicrobia bacterium]|nr:LysR family transcriptional regulator [Verrucomicrobiota bacterium]